MSYTSLSVTAQGSYVTSSGDAAGYVFSPYLRYNIELSKSATLGLGAVGGFGSVSFASTATVISDTTNLTRIGGEVFLIYNAQSFLQPFIRITLSKEFLTDEVIINQGATKPGVSASFGGLLWNFIGGLKIPMNDVIGFYVHGGISIAPESNSTATNTTPDATAVSLAKTYNALQYRVSYTGFLIGGGLSFDF